MRTNTATTMSTANTEETAVQQTETNTTRRNNRKAAAPRPEQLAAEAAIAEVTAAAKPLTPEAQARLEKERAKLEKEQKAAERRAARIKALEAGEELPTTTRGLPPVVKMNDLGATARNLHRAFELLGTDEVKGLSTRLSGIRDTTAEVAELRDEAMRRWQEQHDQRAAAGAASNDTLHPLGLVRDEETGRVTLVEKPKAPKAAAAE